jgi:AcrR family transcriptional regulator
MATTRADRRAATAAEIKQAALRQLAALGAAEISLRGIAGELGITAPAIYRYFPSRDALLTALIADGYRSLAAALRAGDGGVPDRDIAARILAVSFAYRRWALTHPHEFALLFGTPVPGYEAPREETVPAVTEAFQALLGPLVEGWEAGLIGGGIDPSPNLPIPTLATLPRVGIPPALLPVVVRLLGQLHGLTMLELTGHLRPIVGDCDAAFQTAAEAFVLELGLPPPSP